MIKHKTRMARIPKWREWFLKKHSRYSPIRDIRVKSLSLLLTVTILAACSRPATATPTPIPPTATIVPPTATFTPLPTFTPTVTPVPCDPASADYCIVSGVQIFQRPIAAPGNDIIDPTYPFGSTQNNTRKPHHGVEFPNAAGTPVLAAYDGTVFYAGNDSTTLFGQENNFYGNLVILQHNLPGQTVYTLYAHLSKVDAVAGQTVRAGDKIGEVGQTGWAIGSHLHFEVRLDPDDYDSAVNPEMWLLPHEGMGTIAIRLTFENGTFAWAPMDVKYYPDVNGSAAQAWQPEMYPDELRQFQSWENYLVGDLQPGHYRVQFLWRSVWVDRWIEVEAGKVTLVEFKMK
jgi:murein DD-endopeptidase MepM/ murein hydrolase activator NlpD